MDWIKKVLAKEGAEQSAPKPITPNVIDYSWIDKIMREKQDAN